MFAKLIFWNIRVLLNIILIISGKLILSSEMKKKYETGSHHLHRKPFFNPSGDLDMDIPDGDIEIGKRAYNTYCSGCHHLFENKSMGPKLHNIFGKTAATQKGYKSYSLKNRALGFQWSKQRLYQLLCTFLPKNRGSIRNFGHPFKHDFQWNS